MRHVDRVKVGSDIFKEDRTPGVWQFGAYEDDDYTAKPDRGALRGDSTTIKTNRSESLLHLLTFKTYRSIFIYYSFKIFRNRYISYKLPRSIFLYIIKPFKNL